MLWSWAWTFDVVMVTEAAILQIKERPEIDRLGEEIDSAGISFYLSTSLRSLIPPAALGPLLPCLVWDAVTEV